MKEINEMQVFNHEMFGEVRTIVEDGRVLFCGTDVAKALGYSKPNQKTQYHVIAGIP